MDGFFFFSDYIKKKEVIDLWNFTDIQRQKKELHETVHRADNDRLYEKLCMFINKLISQQILLYIHKHIKQVGVVV